METSTPLVSAANGVRRVSISVQNAPVLTPLKRNNRKSTRAKALDEFDDDLERSERRKSAALRKSLVSTDLPANTPLVLNDSVRVMSDNELKTELQLYYKMDVGNKINTRNVWNVRIIDILKLAVRREDLDTLKLGGSSLDIAGKVYGLKIDDIYTAGLKMTGNCFRNNCHGTGDDKGSDDNLDTEASGMENHQQKKKQQKKKRAIFSSGKKHMINSNPKGFLAPLTKLEAVTFSVRADTNLSATANLFTNKIRMDPAGYKFTFASKENAWGLTPGNDPTVNLETNRTFPINAKSVKSFLLCAPFKDFRTDLWDPDQENKELRTSTNTMEEVVFDEDGFPVAELDGSIHNVFEERDEQDLNNDDPIEEEINVPLVRENLEYITNFIPTEQSHAVEWSNYSYNSLITSSLGEKIQKIWAGPSHWKLKCIKPVRREVYSGRDEQRGTRKRRKCGLTEWQPVDLWNLKPPGDFIKWGKKPYKKRNCTLPAHKVLMPLLEVSCYKILDTIDYLMTIPAMKPQKVKKQQDIDYCVTNYNYDNPGDTSYCSQRQANDVNEPDLADDIFGMDDQSCASPGFQEAAFIGDNLVDAPEMVHQKPVYYVTKAKIVDMKKLKIAIWCMLTRKDEFDFSAKVTPTSFQNVWNHLSTVLPKKMMAEENKKYMNSSTASNTSREGRIFFNNLLGFTNILGGDSDTTLDDVEESSSDSSDSEKTRNCTCECGVSNHENRIVGGRPTGINHYPWIARIVYDGHFHCGASLLSESHVLTAAHCVRKLKRSKIRVILGDYDQSTTTDVPAKMRAVSAIIRHRNFDTDTYNHDIALLKLRKPVEFTKNIRPICLPTSTDPAGKHGVVVGWGRTSEGGMLPNVVQEVDVPILTLSQCRAMKYRASRITSYMLCAGRGAMDSCQGDSGGPLLVHSGDKYEIVGIVSWGVGCGRPGYPGVYTRVSRYLNWLKLNLEDNCLCS